MQSKTDDFLVNLETIDLQKSKPRNLEYYEEYSQKKFGETVRMRRENFEKADYKTRKILETKVENEVENFRVWLTETKSVEPHLAHYYSISLKGMLLGIPVGEQVALLFGIVLETIANCQKK